MELSVWRRDKAGILLEEGDKIRGLHLLAPAISAGRRPLSGWIYQIWFSVVELRGE